MIVAAVFALFWLCQRCFGTKRKVEIRTTPQEHRTYLLLGLCFPLLGAIFNLPKFAAAWLPEPVTFGLIAIVVVPWSIVAFRGFNAIEAARKRTAEAGSKIAMRLWAEHEGQHRTHP